MTKELIVITGASSGIGKAIAEKFAEMGHPMLLLARRVELLEAMNLPNTICEKVNVTNLDALKEAIKKAEDVYGPTGCLVNNAGIMLLGNPATQNPEEWKKMFDVNVLGLMNGVHAVLGDMKARKTGTIINMGSIAGRKALNNHAAYCGSKFAVHSITETIREEVALDNVRMITIAPGATQSELISHVTDQDIKDGYQSWADEIGGAIAANDVANAVWFAWSQPQNVCIREIALAPTKQQP
ncbi:SDR family oxidoreductase [Prolixibacteraceae bacterium JC049]|nr:SDR family oxidoreductase [Prolixibacteraceae bacterium JC049]